MTDERRLSHRCSSECDCQVCEDAKSLARELSAAESRNAALKFDLDLFAAAIGVMDRDDVDAAVIRLDAKVRQAEATVARLTAERDEARSFGEDAAAKYNTLLTTCACAFCGRAYPVGTPRHGDGSLADHIKACEEHPMRQVEVELDMQRQRASKLEDAAFHFQTCRACKANGEDSCESGAQFAAFLRGEENL